MPRKDCRPFATQTDFRPQNDLPDTKKRIQEDTTFVNDAYIGMHLVMLMVPYCSGMKINKALASILRGWHDFC